MGHLRQFLLHHMRTTGLRSAFLGVVTGRKKTVHHQGGGLRGPWLQRMLKNRWSLSFRP